MRPLHVLVVLLLLATSVLAQPRQSGPTQTRQPIAEPGVREIRSVQNNGDLFRTILGPADANGYLALERIATFDNRLIAQAKWPELVIAPNKVLPAAKISSVESLKVDSERLLLIRLISENTTLACRVVHVNQKFEQPQCETAATDRATATAR